MVSREASHESAAHSAVTAVFTAWRRLLWQLGSRVRAVDAGGISLEEAAPWASVALASATTAGALAAGGLGDGSPVGIALFAVETTAWALFRLAVIVLASHSTGRTTRNLSSAWAIGLAPYAFGVTPGLRVAAFAASALLTYTMLARARAGSSSGVTTAIAFGGQGVAVLFSWIVVNGLVFLPWYAS